MTDDPRWHWFTLSFADPALEAAWWRHWAAHRGGVIRGAVVLLHLVVVSFTIVDVLAFPAAMTALMGVRLAVLSLILPPAIWLHLGDRADKLARHGQPILLFLTVTVFLGLVPMGLAIQAVATEAQLQAAVPALLFTQIALFGVSGLRFAWAAPVGVVTVPLFFAVLAPVGGDPRTWLLAAVFALGSTVLGLATCAAMETQARREFLQRRQLERERRRSEALLRNIMPDVLAKRLEAGGGPLLERLSGVTVLFATLVDFDTSTQDLGPVSAVELLDRLVTEFDDLAVVHGVERIKTIGGTYMAAAGVPGPTDSHAVAAARLAFAMQASVARMALAEGRAFRLRIGLASGPVLAGVIGRSRYAFDVWGDTANTASRLDTHGEVDRIQVSADTAELLRGVFVVVPRGVVSVKGKGSLAPFWLEA